jgi:glutathione S-transferase
MVTLHGFPFSNYYNMVKHALLVKEVPFTERIAYPGSLEILQVNPGGKVPAMTTEQGTNLAESSVLLDYLEDAWPQHPLYPANADERARVRQLMRTAELYLELPARRLLPAILGEGAPSGETITEVRAALSRGVTMLKALAQFAPYVAGTRLSMADIYLRYALVIPKIAAPALLDWELLDDVPGLAQWDAMMADTDIARKIDAEQRANAEDFKRFRASL